MMDVRVRVWIRIIDVSFFMMDVRVSLGINASFCMMDVRIRPDRH